MHLNSFPRPQEQIPTETIFVISSTGPTFFPLFCKNLDLLPPTDLFPLPRPLWGPALECRILLSSETCHLWRNLTSQSLKSPQCRGVVQMGEHRHKEVMETSSLL